MSNGWKVAFGTSSGCASALFVGLSIMVSGIGSCISGAGRETVATDTSSGTGAVVGYGMQATGLGMDAVALVLFGLGAIFGLIALVAIIAASSSKKDQLPDDVQRRR